MSMTLEETIAKHEAQVELLMESVSGCDLDDTVEKLIARNSAKCADEHRQLVEWLNELQAWRKAYDDCVNTDYESIDDSVRRFTIIGQVVNVRNVFADIRRTDNKNG